MGMMIAIDKSYMNKMPKSCKECPLTYLDTGCDAYFGANESRCVFDDSCIAGMVSERAYDCPLVEAIPKEQYEQRLKENNELINDLEELRTMINKFAESYETRLKADMVAVLTEIQLEIEGLNMHGSIQLQSYRQKTGRYRQGFERAQNLSIGVIQQKINALKAESD